MAAGGLVRWPGPNGRSLTGVIRWSGFARAGVPVTISEPRLCQRQLAVGDAARQILPLANGRTNVSVEIGAAPVLGVLSVCGHAVQREWFGSAVNVGSDGPSRCAAQSAEAGAWSRPGIACSA